MSQVDVSYGILHYNPNANEEARDTFIRTVESFAANKSRSLKSEVFIIDQGNPEIDAEVSESLAREHGFNYVSLRENVGISRGINLLARMSRGQFVSLVTSDVEFTPGLDESLLTTLDCHKDIWQICPASDQSDIPYQRQGYQPAGVTLTFAQELTVQFWPRHVFDKVGYFDERWKACYENMDYAIRIFMAGGYAAVSHEAFCPHNMHMCVRSGAREHTYDDYVGNAGEFDPAPLAAMWNEKWPYINQFIDLYTPISDGMADRRSILNKSYRDSIYMPYVQEVGY